MNKMETQTPPQISISHQARADLTGERFLVAWQQARLCSHLAPACWPIQ